MNKTTATVSLIQRGMSLRDGVGSTIFRMVIDMDETRLQTISQLQALLAGTLEVRFGVPDSDDARYAHIACVAQCFSLYPQEMGTGHRQGGRTGPRGAKLCTGRPCCLLVAIATPDGFAGKLLPERPGPGGMVPRTWRVRAPDGAVA